MNIDQIIFGKKILVVDDEQDVLETIYDLLTDCKIDMATHYGQAKELLNEETYDVAILDIMGVDGYGLLEIAKENNVPAIMLTAHALSEENLVKSAKQGAVYYAPKEEMANIKSIVAEVIEAIQNNKSTWQKMFDRLENFYDNQFNGPDWRKKRQEFWDKKLSTYM